uniref:SPK domain-containing protein n=1 Tax=Panagrolaimus sp. ES5 TaxID=591445 RepID=A0AC34GB83_9BILA
MLAKRKKNVRAAVKKQALAQQMIEDTDEDDEFLNDVNTRQDVTHEHEHISLTTNQRGTCGTVTSNQRGTRGTVSSNQRGTRGTSTSNQRGCRGTVTSNQRGTRGTVTSNKRGTRGTSTSNQRGTRGTSTSNQRGGRGGKRGGASTNQAININHIDVDEPEIQRLSLLIKDTPNDYKYDMVYLHFNFDLPWCSSRNPNQKAIARDYILKVLMLKYGNQSKSGKYLADKFNSFVRNTRKKKMEAILNKFENVEFTRAELLLLEKTGPVLYEKINVPDLGFSTPPLPTRRSTEQEFGLIEEEEDVIAGDHGIQDHQYYDVNEAADFEENEEDVEQTLKKKKPPPGFFVASTPDTSFMAPQFQHHSANSTLIPSDNSWLSGACARDEPSFMSPSPVP